MMATDRLVAINGQSTTAITYRTCHMLGDLMDDVQDDLVNDVRLIKLIIPSSLLRKFFPKLVFAEDECVKSHCGVCVFGGGVGRQTHRKWAESIIGLRSRYENPRKLAESIIWSRSRFRGVDFFASQASGVDF